MKLYNANLSPWAARCRIQIHAKHLPVQIVDAPGGPGSEEFRRKNPIGKVPALEVDGAVIPESEVICEYLEERFPMPSMLGADPLARAKTRLLVRFNDVYVAPLLAALYPQRNPATRDAKLVQEKLADLGTQLDRLEGLLVAKPYAAGAELSLADCALCPTFFFLTRLLPMLGAKSPLEGRPKTAAVGEATAKHPAVAKVLDEMSVALAEMLKGGR